LQAFSLNSLSCGAASMWLRVILLILSTSLSVPAADLSTLPANCRQCLIVTTASWDATAGELQFSERSAGKAWHFVGSPVSVRVGKRGLAWGRGLLPSPGLPGPAKIEGDDKAPAGIFRLGSAFGYAPEAPATRLPYIPLSREMVAIDDPQSRYYNQLIDRSKVHPIDWHSAEKMILSDDRYKWGIVIQHNVPARPGAGSCIFLHVWKDPETSTTGCTAMPEGALLNLMQRLDPALHPLLIQLPAPIYHELSSRWNLPPLHSP
jgi:L,D-peptidoglycan transpeptidase YkuD (ErfK/YbiS/YcfS/YnhG family)